MNLAGLGELLRQRIGLDPGSSGPGLIERAARRRMNLLGIDPLAAASYVQEVERSAEEFQELVEEIVIPESWFFRDEHPFRLLADWAPRRLSSGPDRPVLRVLSMPCARGEEPYSAAMALLEAGLAPSQIRIDGVDLSREAVASAALGVYSRNAFRTADLSFRDRYFQRQGELFVLDPAVRGLVRFQHANLLDPGFRAPEPAYDAVFCRNLLIYLDAPARERVLANVVMLLDDEGLLITGHAEQFGLLAKGFRPVGPCGSFAFERASDNEAPAESAAVSIAAARLAHPKPQPAPTQARIAPTRESRPTSPPSQHGAMNRSGIAESSPGLSRAARLDEAAQLADAGRFEEAIGLCEREINARGPAAESYFLLGMIRQATGNHRQAQSCFERTVYLDGRHEDALLALALLAERRGDVAAAANYHRRARGAHREKRGT